MKDLHNVNIVTKTVELFERTLIGANGNIFSFFSRQLGDSRYRFCRSSNRNYTSISDKSTVNCCSPFSRLKAGAAAIKKSNSVINCNKLIVSGVRRSCHAVVVHQMDKAPKVKLSSGFEMPVLGLGTYESLDKAGERAVKHAIDIGYRHFDTAFFYRNEAEIGKAIMEKIAEGAVKREDIFITTKLWNIHHSPEKVEPACQQSLERLGLQYIDLYLMHLPVGYAYVDEETLLPKDSEGKLLLTDVDYLDTYKEMEKLVKKGLVRSIGVSNFNSEQIQRVLDNCEIKPVTNQVECHPGLNQKQLIKFCKDRDMVVTAFCPLGRPKPDEKTPEFFYSEKTQEIARKYQKKPAQIILRYLIDIGAIPIPKSTNEIRITENYNIFDFKLTDEDIAVMDSFHTGNRMVPFALIKAQNHKYFPFNIEF